VQWTTDMLEQLRQLYPDTKTEEVAAKLGITVRSTYHKARMCGLKKSEAFLMSDQCGRLMKGKPGHGKSTGTQFKVGQKPWNKGMKGLQIGGKATQFKKGHLPTNVKWDGHERIDAEGYVWVRVALGKYVLKHRYVWEQVHGELPKGSVLRFKDGNKQHCELSNLEMIDRREHMSRNTIQRYPEEVKQAIKTVAKLKRVIAKKRSDEE